MHDIRLIRENPAAFDAGLRKRNLAPLSAGLLEIDKRRRAAITESEGLQARRRAAQAEVATRQPNARAVAAIRFMNFSRRRGMGSRRRP